MDLFLTTGHLALWLLVAGLFFPRAALFVAWLFIGPYPANNLSELANLLLWLFFPRFLIAYYIYLDIGTNNLWFWAYIATGVAGFFGESGFVHRRVIRRTKVVRDGKTITTTEEEEIS
jgi:hypothetical protein